ncbi:hypothetical protein [Antrihabitans spumae]|uniref:Uncharacterized protein n=1 Tax=Antrihabitans spumae TaxID=3373370 RepID=A0ABW7JU59_9NOCA
MITIFTGMIALGVVAALGWWGYSTWKSNQLIDDLSTALSTPESAEISGSWSGEFAYISSDQTAGVHLNVDETSPMKGTLEFLGTVNCKYEIRESASDYGTISFSSRLTGSTGTCAEAGEWKISVQANIITGTLDWSSYDNLVGSTLSLHKDSGE